MSAAAAARIPVAEGLFTDDDDVALIGSRCETCGTHYFPQTSYCRNPDCPGGALTVTLFGRHGRLYSYTEQAYQPPPLFAMDPWAPYTLGLIELPEGLRVMAMLTGAVAELQIGMAMELVVERLCVDEAGREVVTFKYRPRDRA